MFDKPLWILLAAVFLPTGLAVASAWGYRKWQDRQGRTSPIVGNRIYGAGEQLRKRIEEDTDKMFIGLNTLFFIGPYFVAAWALSHTKLSEITFTASDWFLVVGFVVIAAWGIRSIIRHGSSRRRGIAGLKAELYTAQELNRLIGEGCTVFHDVPCDGFNLDHVVIGPSAIYVVETKSVRKPRNTGKQDHYKVRQEGDALHFPGFVSRSAIAQARRQAQWLTNYLDDTINQRLPTVATVSLPGWYIVGGPGNVPMGVRVFNPKGRGAMFMADNSGSSIDKGIAALATQALVMRYPISE